MTNKTHEYTLKNGFKLIIKENHRSPIAIFQIFYKVGSSYEENGKTGVSHALEHMMFRGTKSDRNVKFLQTISDYGGQQNAYTTHDYTAYHEIMKADKIPYSFKFEADRMKNLLLDYKSFSKEIEVVMEERRMSVEDNPQRFTLERFFSMAYLSNPYRYPIIGWMDDLKNMTVEDLRNWYNQWYTPNNAIAVVVGDVNPTQIHQLAKKYFGPLKSTITPKPKPQQELLPVGLRTLTVKLPAKLPWMVMGFNVPVIRAAINKWESYALFLLCEILAGGNSSRLQNNIIRKKRLAMSINYYYSPFARMDTVLALLVTPMPEHSAEELKKNIFDEIQKLQKSAVSEKELNRVKVNIIAERVYETDSIVNQAHEIGSFEAVGLSWKDIDRSYKAIEAITLEQIRIVACKYLTPDRLIFAKLEPMAI